MYEYMEYGRGSGILCLIHCRPIYVACDHVAYVLHNIWLGTWVGLVMSCYSVQSTHGVHCTLIRTPSVLRCLCQLLGQQAHQWANYAY